MDKKTKRLWWDVVRHGLVLVFWSYYVGVWWAYVFGKASLESWLNSMMVAFLVTLIDVVEEVKKKPPTDVTVEMTVVVDKPVRILDVKTKLNGKEPTSSGSLSRADAGRVEEDKSKMN